MRASAIIPSVVICEGARAKLLKKYAIGEIVDITIKGEVMVSPGGPVVIKSRITFREERSPKEHRLYWKVLSWLSLNTPEQITSAIGPVSANSWHQLFKDAAGIESTSFDNLEQDEFHQYLNFIGGWLWERFGMILEDIVEHIKEEEG